MRASAWVSQFAANSTKWMTGTVDEELWSLGAAASGVVGGGEQPSVVTGKEAGAGGCQKPNDKEGLRLVDENSNSIKL